MIVKLVYRAHQTNVAFLNEIQELETSIAVLLADRHDEPEIGLDHLRLCPRHVAFASGYRRVDAAELREQQPRLLGELGNLSTHGLGLGGVTGHEDPPTFAATRSRLFQPGPPGFHAS